MKTFYENEVYNANKTRLYFKGPLLMQHSALQKNTKTIVLIKKALERTTVLVCANMTGNDKKKCWS